MWGAHPNPGPTGSTPPNGGICFENWEGACKQKLLLRVRLFGKIKFFGLTPSWGPQGLPHQMGVYGLIIGWGSANKSCSSGWVCHVKFYLWGAHPNPEPAGSTQPNGGICIQNCAGASKQKLLLGVGSTGKILFWGSPQTRAHRVHPTKWGYIL